MTLGKTYFISCDTVFECIALRAFGATLEPAVLDLPERRFDFVGETISSTGQHRLMAGIGHHLVVRPHQADCR